MQILDSIKTSAEFCSLWAICSFCVTEGFVVHAMIPCVLSVPNIAMLTDKSPIVINVPTRGLLAVETKDSFILLWAKFKYQKTCWKTVSPYALELPKKENHLGTQS